MDAQPERELAHFMADLENEYRDALAFVNAYHGDRQAFVAAYLLATVDAVWRGEYAGDGSAEAYVRRHVVALAAAVRQLSDESPRE